MKDKPVEEEASEGATQSDEPCAPSVTPSPHLSTAGASTSSSNSSSEEPQLLEEELSSSHNNNGQPTPQESPTELKIDESRGKIFFRPYRGVQFLDTDDEEHLSNNNDGSGASCSLASPSMDFSYYSCVPSSSSTTASRPRPGFRAAAGFHLPHSSHQAPVRFVRDYTTINCNYPRFTYLPEYRWESSQHLNGSPPDPVYTQMFPQNYSGPRRNVATNTDQEFNHFIMTGGNPVAKKENRRSLTQYWRQNVLPNVRDFCRGHSPTCSNSSSFSSAVESDGQELGACALVPSASTPSTSARKKSLYGPKCHYSSSFGGDSSSSSDSEQKHSDDGPRKAKTTGFLRRLKSKSVKKEKSCNGSFMETSTSAGGSAKTLSRGGSGGTVSNGDPWAVPSTSSHPASLVEDPDTSSQPYSSHIPSSHSFFTRIDRRPMHPRSRPLHSLPPPPHPCPPDYMHAPPTQHMYRRNLQPMDSRSRREDSRYMMPFITAPPPSLWNPPPGANTQGFNRMSPPPLFLQHIPAHSTPRYSGLPVIANTPPRERRRSDTSEWLNHLLNSFTTTSDDHPLDPRMLWWRWLQINQLLESEGEGRQQGLSRERLAALPRWRYPGPPPACHYRRTYKEGHSAPQPEKECQICLCEYVDGDLICLLPCGHELHDTCVSTWLQQKSTCPVCRSPVEPR